MSDEVPKSLKARIFTMYAAPVLLSGTMAGGSAYVGTGAVATSVAANSKSIESIQSRVKEIDARLAAIEASHRAAQIEREQFRALVKDLRDWQSNQTARIRDFYANPGSKLNVLANAVSKLESAVAQLETEIRLSRKR